MEIPQTPKRQLIVQAFPKQHVEHAFDEALEILENIVSGRKNPRRRAYLAISRALESGYLSVFSRNGSVFLHCERNPH